MSVAKIKEMKMAIEMRKKGMKIPEIAHRLSVSKSSVSNWMKKNNVFLTPQQKKSIFITKKRIAQANRASKIMVKNKKNERDKYRNIGHQEAKCGFLSHSVGCALYWAEGSKKRNSVVFSNTDAYMIKVFFDFLINDMHVDVKNIKVDFSYHDDKENATLSECINYWASLLSINVEQLNGFKNKDTRVRTGFKKNRHKYGMAIIRVHKTSVAQRIYGSIEEYWGVSLGF